jgi:predicted nucleic acid-binding protein
MSVSSFPLSASIPLVLDTSVAINFNATGQTGGIMRAFPNPFVVTSTVLRELKDGEKSGHRDAEYFHLLITSGLVEEVSLSQKGEEIFEALVSGDGMRTLDDGEASTIAYAIEASGVAMIDERLARRVCRERYPQLPVLRTVELFLHKSTLDALGLETQITIIFKAIKDKRMDVGPDYLKQVVELIGDERAALCSSLPRIFRRGP